LRGSDSDGKDEGRREIAKTPAVSATKIAREAGT